METVLKLGESTAGDGKLGDNSVGIAADKSKDTDMISLIHVGTSDIPVTSMDLVDSSTGLI